MTLGLTLVERERLAKLSVIVELHVDKVNTRDCVARCVHHILSTCITAYFDIRWLGPANNRTSFIALHKALGFILEC